jgi:ubiquinone/menaquinone biosynthesis C-methylase UbiE
VATREQTTKRTKAFFRRIALKGWRKSAYFTYSQRYPVLRRWLLAQLSATDKAILSIGCGSGELERDLLKQNRRVTGLDICFEMLQAAQQRGLKAVVQADALQLPFAPASFDLVIFPESIGYFELHEVLPGVRSVLKPRGRMMLTAYPTNFASDRIYRKWDVKTLNNEIDSAGFSLLDERLITVKQSRVTEVQSETRSEIIYVLAAIKAASERP